MLIFDHLYSCSDDERIPGLDDLWFVGDNYVAGTFRPFFKDIKARNEESEFFCKRSFETFGFCDSRYASSNNNYVSRLTNTFSAALSKRKGRLPKYIVFIFEDDLIEAVGYKGPGVSGIYGRKIQYIVDEVEDSISLLKRKLPSKAVRHDEPMIYWAALPLHAQFSNKEYVMRVKFNNCFGVNHQAKG